jgi:hypothetical protein
MSNLPIREQIIRALQTRTGALRKLPDYDDRDLPITEIDEGLESATEPGYGMTRATLQLTIARAILMSGVKDDSWHRAQNIALADLIREIYTGGDTLGGLADGIDYGGGAIDLLTNAANGAGVAVTVAVRYSFVHGNPYSQDDLEGYVDPGDPTPVTEGTGAIAGRGAITGIGAIEET